MAIVAHATDGSSRRITLRPGQQPPRGYSFAAPPKAAVGTPRTPADPYAGTSLAGTGGIRSAQGPYGAPNSATAREFSLLERAKRWALRHRLIAPRVPRNEGPGNTRVAPAIGRHVRRTP